MNDPWSILELDGKTATVRDVKSAYAMLLKKHRPDRDPEGFTRVREAYEAAMAELRGDPAPKIEGVKEEPPPPALPTRPMLRPFGRLAERQGSEMPESSSESVPNADLVNEASAATPTPRLDPTPRPQGPQELALEALRQSIATRARQKIRDAWRLYEQEATAANIPALAQLDRVLGIFEQHSTLLAEVTTDTQLIDALTLGESRLAAVVANEWAHRGDTRRMGEFYVSFNRARLTMLDEEGAIGLCLLAKAMGAWVPDNANRLAGKAYPFLPTSRRRDLAEAIDHEVLLGNAVERLPQDHKVFWLSCMRGTDPRCTWKDSESRQLLTTVLQLCGSKWPGFAVLNQRMPKQAWEDMVQAINGLVGGS